MDSSILTAILVDDEPAANDTLELALSKHSDIKVIEKISDSNAALTSILRLRPDIVFLDVQMPGLSGFDIMEQLAEAGVHPAVIFVTAFDKYALEAIRSAAFDYLLKPVTEMELERVIQKYSQRKQLTFNDKMLQILLEKIHQPRRIKLSTAGGFIVLNTEKIVYIEADWNYSEVYLDDEVRHIVTTNIGSLEKMLPVNDFCKISRSLIININYLRKVNRMKRTAVLGHNGKEITFKIPVLNIRKLEKQLEESLNSRLP